MTLVDIPTTTYIEGISAASGIAGVRQRIDARALPNLLAFARAFHDAGYGQLRVQEASRTRPRQLWMYQNRVTLGVTVAYPYTSIHDEINHGNATDFGSNINIFGSPQQRWAAANGPRFGVHPTGLDFKPVREPWHFDIDLATAAASAITEITPDAPIEETDSDMPKNYNAGGTIFTLGENFGIIWTTTTGFSYLTNMAAYGAPIALGMTPDQVTTIVGEANARGAAASRVAPPTTVPPLDESKLAADIVAALQAAESEDVAATVKAALADNFAAIPAAVRAAIIK